MNEVLLTLGFGLVTAAILSLSAVAFTLEYAVTRVANLSHGEILTIGAYTAFLVHRWTNNVLLAALGAAIAGGVVALAMHILVIDRFVSRGIGTIPIFIATLGISFVIQNVLVIFFGAANVAYTILQSAPHQVGPFLWTDTEEEIIISAVAITAALYVIIRYTKFGKALRAVFQNRDLARVTGINVLSDTIIDTAFRSVYPKMCHSFMWMGDVFRSFCATSKRTLSDTAAQVSS